MDYELNIAYRAEMSIQSESEDEDEESGILSGSWWDSNGGYPCGYTNPLGYGDGS
jgi:hypothetical protein